MFAMKLRNRFENLMIWGFEDGENPTHLQEFFATFLYGAID
jgi:hypothetical protein